MQASAAARGLALAPRSRAASNLGSDSPSALIAPYCSTCRRVKGKGPEHRPGFIAPPGIIQSPGYGRDGFRATKNLSLLPVPLNEGGIHAAFDECGVVEDLAMQGNGRLDALDEELRQRAAHAGESLGARRLPD